MRLRRCLFLILPLMAFLASAFFNSARASINDNVRGRGYLNYYGLISFNCLDDDFAGRFPFTFTFRFNVPPCSFSQHGVNLDINNNFSGQAWNPVLGFIDFAATGTPDNYAFNSHCQHLCNASNNCSACYNDNDGKVYGWAKVISGGSWIELNSLPSPPTTISKYTDPQPGIFSGYASSSFGILSFNCLNDSSCGTEDYKVYLWKLDLKEMSAPNWSFANACAGGARQAVFQWLRRSGTQTAYRIIINTANSTSSPVFDSGKLTGSASQIACPGPLCAFSPAYNTSYYWWLQLWNENDEPTEFFQFNTDTYGRLTDNIAYNTVANPDDYNLTFTTYKHEFPTPYFTWSPFDVIVGSTTNFVSDSHYSTTAAPSGNTQLCVDGVCKFQWSVSDGAALIGNATRSTTTIVFVNNHAKYVSLQITDPDSYVCATSSPVLTINFNLPIWKEVKAE